jgi:hypothetical protein
VPGATGARTVPARSSDPARARTTQRVPDIPTREPRSDPSDMYIGLGIRTALGAVSAADASGTDATERPGSVLSLRPRRPSRIRPAYRVLRRPYGARIAGPGAGRSASRAHTEAETTRRYRSAKSSPRAGHSLGQARTSVRERAEGLA